MKYRLVTKIILILLIAILVYSVYNFKEITLKIIASDIFESVVVLVFAFVVQLSLLTASIVLIYKRKKVGYLFGFIVFVFYLIYFIFLVGNENCDCGLLIPSWSINQHFIVVFLIMVLLSLSFTETCSIHKFVDGKS